MIGKNIMAVNLVAIIAAKVNPINKTFLNEGNLK